jgi:diguanylate cyclase (GGDEF)-like protein/PAS domain S-box-containing protein
MFANQAKKPVSFLKPFKTSNNLQKNNATTLKKGESLRDKIKNLNDEITLLTSYSTDTIYRLDYRTMKYDYVSPAIFKLLGFTPQEMKKINFRSLIVETKLVTDGLRTISSFEELEHKRKNGDVGKWQADYLIRTKNAEKIWVSDVSYPWFDETGKVIGSVGSLRDITDRVRIESQILSSFEQTSSIDSLTGLITKPSFFTSVDRELKRSKRSKNEVSIIIFDIDGLEQINSEIGTFIGDKAILRVSDALKSGLREIDIVARIFGGTFAVLLPETSINMAYFVAERIRNNVNNAEIKLAGDRPGIKFTVSAGVAATNFIENLSASDLYKLADIRIQHAKSLGKNQVAIEEILRLN